MQTTLRSTASFEGNGLHSGKPVRIHVKPAAAHQGVWFKRTDIDLGDRMIRASWDMVEISPLCTRIVNLSGVSISTIEHLMAALAGCGVTNAVIEIDGPEVPILDGSSAEFVRGILSSGIQQQSAALHAIQILEPVLFQTKDVWAKLEPGRGLTMDFHIAFDDVAIGRQTRFIDLANGAFVRELCDSRTFCRQADVDAMQQNGLALGGIAGANAVVFDGAHVNGGTHGLRHDDEPVRHKMLDALGDLYLAGMPILGHYSGFKAGHAITNQLLRALFGQKDAYRVVPVTEAMALRMPGAGVVKEEVPQVA